MCRLHIVLQYGALRRLDMFFYLKVLCEAAVQIYYSYITEASSELASSPSSSNHSD